MSEGALAQARKDLVHIGKVKEDLGAAMRDLYRRTEEVRKIMEENHQMINLKLHDIAYEADERDFEHYFYDFCDIHSDGFSYYLDEKGLTSDQVGRTSSFYIVDDSPSAVGYEDNVDGLIDEIADKKGFPDCMMYEDAEDYYRALCQDTYRVREYGAETFEEVNLEKLEEDVLLDFIGDVSDATADMLNQLDWVETDAAKVLNDIEDVQGVIADAYAYVERFKANQIEYWNDYLRDIRSEV